MKIFGLFCCILSQTRRLLSSQHFWLFCCILSQRWGSFQNQHNIFNTQYVLFHKKKFQLETQLGKHGCHQISTFPFNTVHSTYVRMLNSRPYSMYEYSLASSWTGGIVGNNFHNVCTKWLFLATRMKGIILGWLL